MIGRLRGAISRQLSDPSGYGGRLVAVLMNRGNRDLNARAIDLLDVRSGTHVLDLGFGGGLTFPMLLGRGATVTGVDRSQEMVDAARARHRDDIDAGRLTVAAGSVDALPVPDGGVNRVITVNTVYFWPDLPAALRELRRALAPGGRLVIGIRDGSVMDQVTADIFTIRSTGEIAQALSGAGFTAVEVQSAADGKTHLLGATAPLRPGG